jgi:hypothetical protein
MPSGKRRVHPDYHVEVDKTFYSVPHRLIGVAIPTLNEIYIQMIDNTSTHARQQAATAKRGPDRCLACSRGELTTKFHVVVGALQSLRLNTFSARAKPPIARSRRDADCHVRSIRR